MDGEPEQFNSDAKLHLSFNPTTHRNKNLAPVHKKGRNHGRQHGIKDPVHENGRNHGWQHGIKTPVHEIGQNHGREIRKAPKVALFGTFGADMLFTAA